MIRHTDGKWVLFDKDGEKRLGEFDTEQEAKDREAEIKAAVAAKESAPLVESRRLSDTWDRSLTEATIDKAGNLSGVIVVEGESANGNVYSVAALESGRAAFANKAIFVNHPTRSEMRERPERNEHDRVGRLPGIEDLFVESIPDGRQALKFRNGKLSKTAAWLATKIREGISGAMSINASGAGDWIVENIKFAVESFNDTDGTSLDFVTVAAAGGVGQMTESHRTPIEDSPTLSALTFELLAASRPDIVNSIATRERHKAYGEKRQLGNLREVYRMTQIQSKKLVERVAALEADASRIKKDKRKLQADAITAEALVKESPQVRQRVRQLLEAKTLAFIEAEGDPGSTMPGELAPTNPDAEPGDPLKLELPPDAATLPEGAQAIFIETYAAHLAEGEEMATHKAWAAVSASGWVRQGDTWTKMEPEEVAAAVMGEEETVEIVSEESYRAAIAEAVRAERDYLALMTGAGQIADMGAGPEPGQTVDAEQARASLKEAYMADGMDEKQAELAAAGRPGR